MVRAYWASGRASYSRAGQSDFKVIIGTVDARLNAIVNIALLGRNSRRQTVEVVIDTGFDGYLTLPYQVVARLEFPWVRSQTVILGDGNPQPCDVYDGEISWNNQLRSIEIEAADTQPLIGMALMCGFDLHIEVVEGGTVALEPLQ